MSDSTKSVPDPNVPSEVLVDGEPIDWGIPDSGGGASLADILDMKFDALEIEEAPASEPGRPTTTRVDEEIATRAKKSLLIPSERPASPAVTVPPEPSDPGSSSDQASCFAGRYELVGLLGVGGMGSVYRVRDLLIEDDVALKILRKDLADSASAVRRFRKEVRLTRQVTHPNVVRIYDVNQRRNEHYYTMECILGEPLSTFTGRDRPLEVERALDWAKQLAQGVAAVHAAAIVHRDLKPDNIMIARTGRVVITDFGVAVHQDDPNIDVLPMRGAGTPMYMAPEQIEGRNISFHTDLYSLGLLLFELFGGKPPWPHEEGETAHIARLSVPAPSLQSLRSSLPVELVQLVEKLLEREPDERPKSAREVTETLDSIIFDPLLKSVKIPRNESSEPIRSLPQIATTNTPHTRSVGVLPFANLGESKDAYITDAMTASLIEKLIVCPSVRVAKPFALVPAEGEKPRDVGQRVGVDVVVEGSVNKDASGMMSVTVRAIEVERGFALWRREFRRKAVDLFELQAEITAALAEVLALEVPSGRPEPGPTDRDNVDGFLKAIQAYNEWSEVGCNVAIEHLDKALAKSPSDPVLHCYLALAELRKWYIVPRAPAELATSAHGHAKKALEINPNLGEAHLALGMHEFYQANWTSAARRLEEAVRCNPALSEAHRALGYLHCAVDREEDGLGMLEVALRIDPRNLHALWDAAYVVAYKKKPHRVAEYLEQADAAVPNHPETLLARVRIALWLGDKMMLAWAQEHVEELAREASITQGAAMRLFVTSEPEEDIGTIAAIAADTETPPASRIRLMQLVAERMALGGQVNEAWSALRAVSAHTIDSNWFQRCPALTRMSRVPAFASLRSHVAARAAQLFASSRTSDPSHKK